jgi:hypothetical protein
MDERSSPTGKQISHSGTDHKTSHLRRRSKASINDPAENRFYEGERRPGIDYPRSTALTEENRDDTT